MEFHQTGYGRTFFEYQLPELIKQLSKIAKELERANNLKEQELKNND